MTYFFRLGATFLAAIFLLPASVSGLAKEFGLGYIGGAYPHTSTAVNFNPALVTAVGDRYDFSAAFLYQKGRSKIKDSDNPAINFKAGSQRKYIPFGSFGLSRRLGPNLYVAITTDSTRSAAYAQDRPIPAFGTSRQAVDVVVPLMVPTIGCKINDCHSIGVSFPLFAGRARIKGFQNLAPFSISPDHFTNKGYDYAYGLGLRFGWFWHVDKCLDFGLSYNTQLLNTSHWKKYRGFIPSRGLFEVPPELRAGLAYHFKCLSFILELHYTFYDLAHTLHNSPDKPFPFGSTGGPGLGWKNLLYPGIGIDFRMTEELTLRAGAVTRVPSWTGRSNTVPNFANPFFTFRQAFTFGATWKTECGYEFSFAYLYAQRDIKGKRELSLQNGRMNTEMEGHAFYFDLGKVCF